MKRFLKFEKWVPNNVRKSIYPLIFINWLSIFGFSGYPLGGKKQNKFASIPVILLLGILCWMICDISYQIYTNAILSSFAYAFEIVYAIDTIVIFAAHINGWLYFKKLNDLYKCMTEVDDATRNFRFKDNYSRIFKTLLGWIFAFLCLGFMSEFLLYEDFNLFGIQFSVFYIATVMDLNVHSNIQFISINIELLNNWLIEKFTKNLNRSIFHNQLDNFNPNSSAATEFHSSIETIYLESENLTEEMKSLQKIKYVYLSLYIHSKRINQIYQMHFLLQTLSNLYNIAAWVSISILASEECSLFFFAYLLKAIKSTLRFYLIIAPCCQIEKQSDEMIRTLAELANYKTNASVVKEMDDLRQQMIQLPIIFSIFGFQKLGITFIEKFAVVCTTVFGYIQYFKKMVKSYEGG